MDGAMLDADSAVRADMLDKKIAAERARAAALTVAHNATGRFPRRRPGRRGGLAR